MSTTVGNLTPAIIKNMSTGEEVKCMFNPHEYTLTKQNQYKSENVKGLNAPQLKFEQGGAETLKLQLFFDTFATGGKVDVREHTAGLWKMMMITQTKKNESNNKGVPPTVEFNWGGLSFEAVITNISQKFTLFDEQGIPLRTTVDVSFQQVTDKFHHDKQNPTSGGGPPMKLHIVQAGDRLDWIAAKIYGDSKHWRLIANTNKLRQLMPLKPGQQLLIPPLE